MKPLCPLPALCLACCAWSALPALGAFAQAGAPAAPGPEPGSAAADAEAPDTSMNTASPAPAAGPGQPPPSPGLDASDGPGHASAERTAAPTAAEREGRERVERGEALFDAENFDAALVEYEKAYELLAGHPVRPELLFNIALCHERRFRYTQAMAYYRRYLDEAGPAGESRAEVEGALHALGNLLATVDIRSNVKAEVWIDDNLVGEAPGTILVPSGMHTLALRARGFESSLSELRVTAREHTSLSFALTPLDEGLSPVWFYSSLGATLALGGVGAGFAGKLVAEHRERTSGGARIAKNRPSDEEDLASLALRADVFFAAAAVLAVGTGLLALFTDFDAKRSDRAPARAALRVSPGGLSLAGRF